MRRAAGEQRISRTKREIRSFYTKRINRLQNETVMENTWDLSRMLGLVKPWLKHLIGLGIATVLLAALFSSPWFITPLYQSQARVYPANINAFSEESESEQMLEVFSSTDLKRKMIDVFQLKTRYRVRENDRYAQTHVLRKYHEYVSLAKTRYETIEISVLDADPDVACAMVDSLIGFYNQKMLTMRRAKYEQELAGFRNDLARKQAEVDTLNLKMEQYRRLYGLLDYGSQTHQLTLGYAEVLARGAARSSVDDLQRRLDLLADKGGEFWQMQNKMEELFKQRDGISKQIEDLYSLVNRPENFALVVEKPFPADKKSYPVRWLIVVVALFSTELIGVLLALLLGTRRQNA